MSGGGGGGGGFMQQDNTLAAAQAKADADRKAQETKTNEDRNISADKRDAAYAASIDRARALLGRAGTTDTAHLSDIMPALDYTRSTVPDSDPNPAAYFTDDVINNAISGVLTGQRAANQRQVNARFSPGFENQYIPDTADDQYINEILADQQGGATKSLDYAKARGQLNDSGYSTAATKLGTQATGARSTLNSIGSGVINKDRAGLTALKGDAITGANSYNFGDPDFSVAPYERQIGDAYTNDMTNLKGDIVNALGNTKLFNVNDILLAGSQAQGPQNLTTSQPVALPPKKVTVADRGLGGTGVF